MYASAGSDWACGAPAWYVLRVRPHHERTVLDALSKLQRINGFLPTYSFESRWSDRTKTITRPLFPGYLFVECERADLAELLQLAGVLGVLPNNLAPYEVPEKEMALVRKLELLKATPAVPAEYLAGDRVKVNYGPLRGIEGVVVRAVTTARLVISIEFLNRVVMVQLNLRDIAPKP